MKSKAPSPRSRQMVMAIVLVGSGLVCIYYGHHYDLVVAPSAALTALGAFFAFTGVVIRIMAYKEIPCALSIEKLVTSGIYSKTRNPVYLAVIAIIIGIAFLSRSLLSPIWVLVSVLALSWAARKEERDLEKVFGDAYVEYRKAVPMFLPRLLRRRGKPRY